MELEQGSSGQGMRREQKATPPPNMGGKPWRRLAGIVWVHMHACACVQMSALSHGVGGILSLQPGTARTDAWPASPQMQTPRHWSVGNLPGARAAASKSRPKAAEGPGLGLVALHVPM
jgi:hypothetical protein